MIAVEQMPARDSANDLLSRRIANGLPAGTLAYAATATSAPLLKWVGLLLLFMAALFAWAAQRRATPSLRA